MRHFLEIDDLSPDELRWILDAARQPPESVPQVLAGSGVALVFEKASARTRNSMEMAVRQLGGHPVYIRPEEVGMDERETAEDIVRTLGCYHDFVAARVSRHDRLERMAACEAAPIINLLSDQSHPTQALADLLTIDQCLGLANVTRVAYVGDANNVWHSLKLGCALMSVSTAHAGPNEYGSSVEFHRFGRAMRAGGGSHSSSGLTDAVTDADVIYTDVWVSMGQEAEAEARREAFAPYQVNQELMSLATSRAIFMHCLPANRGEEVTDEVIDGPASRVWLQAENRMHTARALLWFMAEQRSAGAPSASSRSSRSARSPGVGAP